MSSHLGECYRHIDNRRERPGRSGEDSEGKQNSWQNLVIKHQLCRDLRAQNDQRGKDAKVVAGTISASLEKRAKRREGGAGDRDPCPQGGWYSACNGK